MKKVIITICLILTVQVGVPNIVLAENPSSSTSSAEFQSKLRSLQTEIASKAAKLKQEISKRLEDKAYIGKITSTTDEIITINNQNGEEKTIKLNEFTNYLDIVKNKKLSVSSLLNSDTIITLGDIDDNGVLTAKKLIKADNSVLNNREIIYGTVTDLKEKKIVLKDSNKKTFEIVVDKDTTFQTGKYDARLSDIRVNKSITAVVTLTHDAVYLARFVYIFPYSIQIKSKTSTQSATE